MNFTESFDQFAQRVSGLDLALYAGAGIILYIIFKEKLPPIQKLTSFLSDKLKTVTTSTTSAIAPVVISQNTEQKTTKEDLFFALVSSWKQTRDLAVASGCDDAVKAADDMFPFLSPQVCQDKKEVIKS
jgi:hypothetical protein